MPTGRNWMVEFGLPSAKTSDCLGSHPGSVEKGSLPGVLFGVVLFAENIWLHFVLLVNPRNASSDSVHPVKGEYGLDVRLTTSNWASLRVSKIEFKGTSSRSTIVYGSPRFRQNDIYVACPVILPNARVDWGFVLLSLKWSNICVG